MLDSHPAEEPGRANLEYGAHDANRTRDLVLTKDVLCQLSYVGHQLTICFQSHAPGTPLTECAHFGAGDGI